MPLGPGSRLGSYEILQLIGAGGMGEVHRARHAKLRRDLAIKVLPATLAGDPSRLARFEREARTASSLNHPNIVTIYDIAEHEGTALYLFGFIPRGGRVLVYPVYQGTYERSEPPEYSPGALRDRMIRWTQDLARTIDFLETRPDFDSKQIADYGFSAGAVYGPLFTAVEPRSAASVLLGGGLVPEEFRPEVDPAAIAPRSRMPTLMINGRDDFILPYELSEQLLFALLGAPEERKRHARLAGGHNPTNRLEIVREVLDWLDRQPGPVQNPVSVAPELPSR